MKKIISMAACLALISASCTQPPNQPGSPYNQSLLVKDQRLLVELVDTPPKMELGLSNRDSLPEQTGMLFDFRSSLNKTPSFWMKDMQFDIDIIWIRDSRVIGITERVPRPNQSTDLPLYHPPAEIDYVLEVNSGWSDAHEINPGDVVQLNLP